MISSFQLTIHKPSQSSRFLNSRIWFVHHVFVTFLLQSGKKISPGQQFPTAGVPSALVIQTLAASPSSNVGYVPGASLNEIPGSYVQKYQQ